METTLSDEKIVALYLDRDETAIPQTDRKYRNYLYTIAYHILSSHEDSEECLNDTYLRTWNAIPPAVPACLRAFLAKITRNLSLDRWDAARSQKRIPPALCDSLTDLENLLSDSSIEAALDAKAITQIIAAYLDGVSERKLYIFVSRYYFMTPIRQIAAALHVSISTVDKTLAAMKKELRSELEKGGIQL